jgi:ribosomal protein L24
LATKTYADSAVSTHESDTTNIHGIADTSALATKTYADSAVSTHESDTTNIHGIADTSALATKTYADNAVTQEAITTASNLGTAVSNHNSATTSVHGIADTSALATKTYVDDADNLKSNIAGPTFTGTVTIPTLSVTTTATGITATMVGLGNVDNTSDANKPVSTATQTALDAKLALAGGTMTGALTLSGAPTSDLHAVTKQYVDGLAAGINFHQPVIAATAGNLAGTYNNGTSGVGATLTKATNGSIGTIDGAAVAVGDRILLRAQTDAKENGIYTITAVGDGSNPWQITRAADSDNSPAGEVSTGDFVFVTSGSSNGSKGFLVSTTGTITIGTTNISYVQFNASEAVIAGTNITKDGATIAVENAPTFSGVITASSGVAFSDGTQTKEGVPSRTPIISKTANYTLSELSERDSLIEVDSTSPVTITIPTNSAVAYPIGTTLDILGTNTGLITIAGDTGVTVNATPGLKLRTQWSSCTLFKRATNSWVVYGDLKA